MKFTTSSSTSTEAFNNIICKVNLKYGAPTGRASDSPWNKPKDKRIYDRIVYLDSGGYDRHGAYWGLGPQLRVEYTKDLLYVRFYRIKFAL